MRPPSWYLLFSGDDRPAWWNIFTGHRPGFQHVAAYRFLPETETWILVDWHARQLAVESLSNEQIGAIIAAAHTGEVSILKVRGRVPKRRVTPVLGYCVPAIMHLIGFRAWWVWTPWQLYCALRVFGGQVMYAPCMSRADEQPSQEAEGAEA